MATTLPSNMLDGVRQASKAPPEAVLPASRLIAFSSLAFPVYAAQTPVVVYLPALYAGQFGLPLTLIGTIFLAERLWGAFADPVIGALSDRTTATFGRRRTWITAGGVVFCAAASALFFPPSRVSPFYLGGALFIFYLGWSMIQIPYLAWSGEVSGDYRERTRIATYQQVATATSLLASLVLPTVIDQVRPGDARLTLAGMGVAILLPLLPALALTLMAFPDQPLRTAFTSRPSPWVAVRIVFGDRLLLRVLLSDFAVVTGQSIRGALFVFFVSIYMGMPRWASGLFLLQYAFGIAASPIWLAISRRWSKHRAAIAGELVQVAINLGLLLVVPGQLALLLALTVAQGLAQSSGNLMLRSMVADIADNHRLKTGHDRTALFFSAFSISLKAAMAVAVGIALPLVAWAGFNPTAGAHNSPAALRALLLVFALGPAIAHLISAALLQNFPLDESAHVEIRRALDARDAQLA